jgi:hypothetical protein
MVTVPADAVGGLLLVVPEPVEPVVVPLPAEVLWAGAVP